MMTGLPNPLRRRLARRLIGAAASVLSTAAGLAQDFPMERGVPAGDAGRPAPVFFPPTPPPLGRPVSRLAAPVGGRHVAPPELALYLNEIFYPPLSTRLAKNDLPAKIREKLDAYRDAKTKLQAELRAEFERTRDADATARRTALEALARQQAPRLAQLEQTAEDLRAELNTGETDWSAFREWRLGGAGRSARGDSPSEVAQVMRATAYYQAGLLPAQRRLLREIALEVAVSAEDEAKAAAAQPFLFFPPEPARVLLPDDLPADLAALVGDFQTRKSALKKELYDLVYAEDSATFGFTRTAKFRSLAGRQAARLAELERLADRIRAGLRLLPDPTPPPPRSPLPPALTERTIALIHHRASLQNETRTKLDDLGLQLRALAILLGYQFDGEGIKTQIVPLRRGQPRGAPDSPQLADLRAKVSAVEADYRARNEVLVAEINALRSDVAQVLRTSTPATVDNALNEVARYMALRDNEEGYRDYRLAVFEPGLSPEQRRLVFDGAMEKLSLPLPRGDLQPMRRAATW